ncbi:MAG TPA: hypothetical protein VLM89_06235, partial [Phycisphaerae bacterium]|nr:hypothetical protein [Phycisphaerae bacterium]
MTHDATDLDKRLAAVGRRITLRRALQESADFIPAVVLTGFALGIADHLIRFSVPGRWAELLIFLFVISFALVRMAVRIIRQPRSRKAAAEHIESLDPRFGGRLLSYVCFRGSTRGTAGQASPALIAAMCRRIEEQTRDLDAARLVPLRRLRFRFLAAAATVLAALTIILVEREAAQTWFIRISHPQVAVTWPARTRIGGLQPAYRVRRGDRLRVTGHISGRIPAAARLELWSPASENHATRRTTESMSVSPDGSFSASIGPLIQSAAMRLHAGDAHTPIVPIEVTFPPGLS